MTDNHGMTTTSGQPGQAVMIEHVGRIGQLWQDNEDRTGHSYSLIGGLCKIKLRCFKCGIFAFLYR
jgi:hypothetical protein